MFIIPTFLNASSLGCSEEDTGTMPSFTLTFLLSSPPITRLVKSNSGNCLIFGTSLPNGPVCVAAPVYDV